MARIGTRQMVFLFRRAATSLRAGVDARRVWQQEAERGSARQRAYTARISQRVNQGDHVADAMEDCDGFFPPLACELVRIGEKTGKLDEVLFRLADHYEHLLRMRRQFLAGITWPAIQLLAAILIVGLLIWIVGALLPKPVDILGFGLMGTTGLLVYLVFVASIAGAITLGVMSILRGWAGPTPMLLAMRIPVVGGCIQTMALARLAWSLSMALESGVDARNSMQMALRSTQNVYYQSHMDQVDEVLIRGGEFHEALRTTGAFPDEFVDSLETAELAGTQSESMLALSKEYEERARATSDVLTVMATFAIWAMVALIFIFLIFRIAMFYIGALYDAAGMS